MRFNDIEEYRRVGWAAGRARKHGDEGMAQFHKRWLIAALELEEEDYRKEAEKAFHDAYRKGRG